MNVAVAVASLLLSSSQFVQSSKKVVCFNLFALFIVVVDLDDETHTLHKRIREKKNQNTLARLTAQKQPLPVLKQVSAPAAALESITDDSTGSVVASLESGVTLGSGEYFMDVFVGTPPKHFSLIIDTGSDLNWIQCLPCNDCFEQNVPFYSPQESNSFHSISCHDPRCQLVYSSDHPEPRKAENQSCP
ncbi:hypothetical protein NE237_005512 [Protea cynaroides]|uniref:Peptidase A1 domain-containing protein n=1 Tax=Protea cynaroides TaxID=273540 RepID=A0A9Q0KKQ0_9MAGN|nr:hypothetical protein NE237_005512 [Protea cynaroides]